MGKTIKTPRVIRLPARTLFRYNIRTALLLSVIVILSAFIAASAGLIYRDLLYPTQELSDTFIPNDIVNLLIGIPLLLASVWLARRNRLIGFLCWPGSLFYFLYTYIPYLLSIPFYVLFLPYLTIVTLSACTIIYIVAGINGDLVKEHFEGKVPDRLSGGILLTLALLIVFRQVAFIVAAHVKQSPVIAREVAVWIADLSVACPALITTGLLQWRKRPLGYVAGAGLLLSYGILSLGLIIVLILRANLTKAPVNSSDIFVLLIMAGACLFPFTVYLRRSLASFSASDN